MSGYITRPQAAKLAGVSVRTIERYLEPDGKDGNTNIYDIERVRAWAKTYERKPGGNKKKAEKVKQHDGLPGHPRCRCCGNKKTVKVKQPPKVGSNRKFSVPISARSARRQQPPRMWTTCDQQIAATISGEVAPLYVISTAPAAWDWRTSVSFIGYGGNK